MKVRIHFEIRGGNLFANGTQVARGMHFANYAQIRMRDEPQVFRRDYLRADAKHNLGIELPRGFKEGTCWDAVLDKTLFAAWRHSEYGHYLPGWPTETFFENTDPEIRPDLHFYVCVGDMNCVVVTAQDEVR